MRRERIGQLQRGVLSILLDKPEGIPAKDVLQRMEQVAPPTDYEAGFYPKRPHIRRFEKIIRFTTIPLVKAGWMIKSKGRWHITEEGKRALEKYSEPAAFSREARRLYSEWRGTQPELEEEELEETASLEPSVSATSTIEEADEAAWAEVEQFLKAMNPYDLQNLVAALLRGMGYHVSWVSPPGPDKGIDIIAHTDPLGTTVPRIKVQVKRRTDTVNVEGLRSFMALLGEEDVGIFVATGGFTKDAEAEARTQEKRKITLVDLERLFDLWVEHYSKVAEADRRLLSLRPVYYLAPTE